MSYVKTPHLNPSSPFIRILYNVRMILFINSFVHGSRESSSSRLVPSPATPPWRSEWPGACCGIARPPMPGPEPRAAAWRGSCAIDMFARSHICGTLCFLLLLFSRSIFVCREYTYEGVCIYYIGTYIYLCLSVSAYVQECRNWMIWVVWHVFRVCANLLAYLQLTTHAVTRSSHACRYACKVCLYAYICMFV